jgi:hypothetical protein
MKPTLFILTICTILFCSTTFSTQLNTGKRIPFKVYIEQDGMRQPLVNNTVSLQKKPFKIVLVLDKSQYINICTSFNKETYSKALANEPYDNLPGFKGGSMAEVDFNPDKQVDIADSGFSTWFYVDDEHHRFNTITKTGDNYVCTREVEQVFFFKGKNIAKIPIKQMNKPIYFVFIDYEYNSKNLQHTIIQREMIKINWK